MTKEEILAMESGKELNKLVAEMLGDSFQHQRRGKLYHQFKDIDTSHGWENPAPVSRDIAAAWLVLKKLREEYWCIEIKIADGCWVIMELLKTPPIRVEVNAGTPFERLPEAICKAALIARLEESYA